MEEKKKRSFWESFKIWFGLGALMFGTYCGANMASGVYATTYMVTFGGGWMWVCLAIFIAFMAFFCAVSLNFIRAYKVDNYNSYYLALWGADKPGTNPVVKVIVSIFFDVYTTLMGVVTVAATIALFANLMESLFNIPIAHRRRQYHRGGHVHPAVHVWCSFPAEVQHRDDDFPDCCTGRDSDFCHRYARGCAGPEDV